MYNAVYLFPDQPPLSPLSSFENLRFHADCCHLPASADGSIAEDEYGALMVKGGAQTKVLLDFYDRNPNAFDWYYTAHGLADASALHGINSLASILFPSAKTPIYGPVVVVKNAPASVWHLQGKAVSDEGVVRTLWWYYKSGSDPDEVYKERTLIRLFANRSL
ncbi:hypothetical protein FA95DRAFT_1504172 [Auriscalpium vulgare]|uniref:Uncharacterized protein n=1 Tax=Auriscalpium vulgare TaxID=40419 RepID=A0ACB8R7A6_9AGAM|nr:hypothetical protein FA95DRAFT_1504172 [Auriscalpium vulgare]